MDAAPLLMSTAYLPPVSYFCRMAKSPAIMIEKHEHFIKQTYRNRCVVMGANGPVVLVIPVEKARGHKIAVKDTRIYNRENWQRIHWRTIFSAYNSSPFFEYYEDYFRPFYVKNWEFLFDYNWLLLETLLGILDFLPELTASEKYDKTPEGFRDLRDIITPKNKLPMSFNPYTQVFSEKFGFIPDLSIIDLIFNAGPESMDIVGM